MKLYSQDGSVVMEVQSLEPEGDDLVIKGKVFGAMPLTARLRPSETRNLLKLINPGLFLFLITLPFRRSR